MNRSGAKAKSEGSCKRATGDHEGNCARFRIDVMETAKRTGHGIGVSWMYGGSGANANISMTWGWVTDRD